tara:strand:+ start:547 stop:660 length:114 start_codon:yes stop_codon:yes gene_type:complete
MVKINVNKLDYESEHEVQRSKVKIKKKIRKMKPREGK